jgi:hypothetical protein
VRTGEYSRSNEPYTGGVWTNDRSRWRREYGSPDCHWIAPPTRRPHGVTVVALILTACRTSYDWYPCSSESVERSSPSARLKSSPWPNACDQV